MPWFKETEAKGNIFNLATDLAIWTYPVVSNLLSLCYEEHTQVCSDKTVISFMEGSRLQDLVKWEASATRAITFHKLCLQAI